MDPDRFAFIKSPWMTWPIRLLLGSLFIWAGGQKVLDPEGFALVLYGYGVFPGAWINLLALWVPFVEMVAGFCLILGENLPGRSGLFVVNSLLACFILLISFNLVRGHEFDCGCFSLGQKGAGQARSAAISLLIRDLLLLGAGGLLWAGQRPLRDPDQSES